jgi:YGGT family
MEHTHRQSAWIARAIGYLILTYVTILSLGFILKLFGADPSAGFTQWAYRNLERVMSPFRGIFAPVTLGTTGNEVDAVLDTSILFAMIVYGILLLALRAVVDWLTMRIDRIDQRIATDEAALRAELPTNLESGQAF